MDPNEKLDSGNQDFSKDQNVSKKLSSEDNSKTADSVSNKLSAEDNSKTADSVSQCKDLNSIECGEEKCNKHVTNENKSSSEDHSLKESTEGEKNTVGFVKTVIDGLQSVREGKIEKKESLVKDDNFKVNEKYCESKNDIEKKLQPSSSSAVTSVCVKNNLKIETKFQEELKTEQECIKSNNFESDIKKEPSFEVKCEGSVSNCEVKTDIKVESLLKLDQNEDISDADSKAKDESSSTKQLIQENSFSSLESEIKALENEIEAESFHEENDKISDFSKTDKGGKVKATPANEDTAVKCNEVDQKSMCIINEIDEESIPLGDESVILDEVDIGSKKKEEEDANTQSCTASEDQTSLTQCKEFPDEQEASENKECLSSKITNSNNHTVAINGTSISEKRPPVTCDNLEVVSNVENRILSEDSITTECKLTLVSSPHKTDGQSSNVKDLNLTEMDLNTSSVLERSNDLSTQFSENINDGLKDDSMVEDEDGEILGSIDADAENLEKTDKDSTGISDLSDNSPSLSPTFCDSTVLDTSSTDEMETQDCSINESNILKGKGCHECVAFFLMGFSGPSRKGSMGFLSTVISL